VATRAARRGARPPEVRTPKRGDVSAAAFPVSASAQQDLRAPDRVDPKGGVDLRSPDSRYGRPSDAPAVPRVTIVEAPAAEGFDWGDAGVGAAGGLAILTLASGMGMVATQRRRRTRLSAITK
jgi:hypothetical protein